MNHSKNESLDMGKKLEVSDRDRAFYKKNGYLIIRNVLGEKECEEYIEEAQAPILVAMIEHERAVENLEDICKVDGLDALLIGPYDLSASMNMTAEFQSDQFIKTLEKIQLVADKYKIPCGIHIVTPSPNELEQKLKDGYQFLAYSIDSVFLNHGVDCP